MNELEANCLLCSELFPGCNKCNKEGSCIEFSEC